LVRLDDSIEAQKVKCRDRALALSETMDRPEGLSLQLRSFFPVIASPSAEGRGNLGGGEDMRFFAALRMTEGDAQNDRRGCSE
jgi:hypothetical protein